MALKMPHTFILSKIASKTENKNILYYAQTQYFYS